MAYTPPSTNDLASRYPAFEAIEHSVIRTWLDDAAIECAAFPDDTRARAEMAYAAHRMAEIGVIKTVPAGVTSFKSGDFSASVDASVASRTGFASTVYGREFNQLRRRHFAGPIAAWTPPGV